jgi:hypothetical protein
MGATTTWALLLATGLAAASCGNKAPSPAHDDRAHASPASDSDPDRAFWNWFVEHAAELATTEPMVDAMNRVQRELDKGHHEIYAELGRDGDERLLVLTADGIKDVFPAVQRLFAARPSVKRWKIVAFRPRDTTRPMFTLDMDGHKLDPATVRYVTHRNHEKLDIQLFIPGYVDKDETMAKLAYLALDHTAGEYDVETKLAGIELLPADHAPSSARALEQLPAELDALGPAQPSGQPAP